MITERQRKILDVVINEYINSAQPISSQFLFEKHDFGLCPATLRIEMKNLTDLGLLQKPHISSGRVPTDTAYRLFVNKLLESDYENDYNLEIENNLNYSNFASRLADISSGFVVFYLPEKSTFWQAGFDNLIRSPEFSSKEFIINFLSFLEELNKNQQELNLKSQLEIFIGKENFLSKGEDFSLICAECYLNDEEKFRLSLIGPKRMDYYKNISILNYLIKNLEKNI